MIDTASILERDPIRATLAQQMAAFEAKHGKVQTSPIRTGEAAQIPWRIHCPDRPKPDRTPVVRKTAPERKPRPNMLLKLKKIELLKRHALAGDSIEQMVEATGYSRKYITRLIWDKKIKRGTKTNLEG